MLKIVAATRLDDTLTTSDAPTDVASALAQLCESAEKLEPPRKKRRISDNEATDSNGFDDYITLSDIDIELVNNCNGAGLGCTDDEPIGHRHDSLHDRS